MTSPRFPVIWSAARLVAAIGILVAIVGQLIRTTGRAIEEGGDVAGALTNFFSFFTILSNALAMVVLVLLAVWVLRRRADTVPVPLPLAAALAAVSTYMIITGIVYNSLLRNIPLPQGATVPWSNEILHVYAPIFLLADVIVGARVRALRWRALVTIAAFPVVWVIYTLIRGPLASDPFTGAPTWYPYPFLNPANGGYLSVAIYIVIIAAAIIGIGAVVIWAGRARARTGWPHWSRRPTGILT